MKAIIGEFMKLKVCDIKIMLAIWSRVFKRGASPSFIIDTPSPYQGEGVKG